MQKDSTTNEHPKWAFRTLSDRDIETLRRIKEQMLPKSIAVAATVVGVIEGSRFLFKRYFSLPTSFNIQLPTASQARMNHDTFRHVRFLALFIGIAMSFSYVGILLSNERQRQCTKYNDLLNQYLDYKERRMIKALHDNSLLK